VGEEGESPPDCAVMQLTRTRLMHGLRATASPLLLLIAALMHTRIDAPAGVGVASGPQRYLALGTGKGGNGLAGMPSGEPPS
jgi:hypothetical protein